MGPPFIRRRTRRDRMCSQRTAQLSSQWACSSPGATLSKALIHRTTIPLPRSWQHLRTSCWTPSVSTVRFATPWLVSRVRRSRWQMVRLCLGWSMALLAAVTASGQHQTGCTTLARCVFRRTCCALFICILVYCAVLHIIFVHKHPTSHSHPSIRPGRGHSACNTDALVCVACA